MAVTAILQYGNLPADGTLVDEPNLLVQSLTVTPAREKKEYKGVNRAVGGISLTNPTLALAFKAYIGEAAGLAIQHPGTQVADLANYAGSRHGFSPSEGFMLYDEASSEYTNEDADMVNFTVTQYPFVIES